MASGPLDKYLLPTTRRQKVNVPDYFNKFQILFQQMLIQQRRRKQQQMPKINEVSDIHTSN
eukprot:198-Heterococcus_DN1.PRE.6